MSTHDLFGNWTYMFFRCALFLWRSLFRSVCARRWIFIIVVAFISAVRRDKFFKSLIRWETKLFFVEFSLEKKRNAKFYFWKVRFSFSLDGKISNLSCLLSTRVSSLIFPLNISLMFRSRSNFSSESFKLPSIAKKKNFRTIKEDSQRQAKKSLL